MEKNDFLKEQVSKFPLKSGVYIMKNSRKEFLYVGKAKELKKRVMSYLRSTNSGKVEVLMSHVDYIEYMVTESEYEALLLEHNLIKEHQPKYNILLRDDKTFPMIKITHEEYPRILKTRRVLQDKAEYFGPYIDVHQMNKYIDLIEKNFALRRCSKIKKREHPCLYYHIGRCTAVCAGKTSKEEYLQRVKKIRSLLRGHTKTLKKELTVQMHKRAQHQDFESAAQSRDSLLAIEALEVQQHMIAHQKETRNFVGHATQDNKCCIVVIHMKEGRIVDQHMVQLSTFDSIEDSLEQFYLSYYYDQKLFPEFIFSPLKPSRQITQFFSEHDAVIDIPKDPQDVAVMRFASQNAKFGLKQFIISRGNNEGVLALQSQLALKNIPMRIEGFDIATLQGKHTVAAMVSFYDGVPDKSQYRYFKIKSLAQGKMDDFQSIQEAVSRRYAKLKNEKLSMPDLILIDGGLGQVNAAKEILDLLAIDVPVVGLAKKEEEIYFPGRLTEKEYSPGIASNPLRLPVDDPASKLLQYIRDEAHRFGTKFREQRQIDELRDSVYLDIKGIGEKKARRLMELFPDPKTILTLDKSIIMQGVGLREETVDEMIVFLSNIYLEN